MKSSPNSVVTGLKYLMCWGVVLGWVMACTPQATPTPRPTHALSGPTLEASPTVRILTSDQLYQNDSQAGANEPTAAAMQSGGDLPPIDNGTVNPDGAQGIEVVLMDGSKVLGDLYESNTLERVPAILLLSTDRTRWGNFPQTLQSAGFTVMALSLPRTDYGTAEFDAMLNTLSVSGSVNPGLIAVIGETESADFALQGCAINLLCDALVLLSPVNRDSTQSAITSYKPRPLLLVAAQDDALSYPTSLALSGITQGQSTFIEYPTGRGSGLLTLNIDLALQIAQWLKSQLQ